MLVAGMAAALVLGPAVGANALSSAGGSVASPGGAVCEWPMYGYSAARTMSSACQSAPTTSNVSLMTLKWRYNTADVVTATPTVVNGTVYVGDWSGNFYAINLATGALDWSTVIGPNRTDGNADQHTGAYGTITSSAAVTKVAGKLMAFVGGGGSLYALNASPLSSVPDAQRVLWRVDFDPDHPTSNGEVESSPVVWQTAPGGPIVFVGSDANQDSGYVGEGVWAVRAATGQVLWHFNPEVDDPAIAHPALYGCGNVWSSPALEVDRNNPSGSTLFFGTADCPDNGSTPCPSDGSDPGCPPGQTYNYSERWSRDSQAVLAVSALTGTRIWSWQPYPQATSNDDDMGASAQLFTTASKEKVVGVASKDGTYTVLGRASGQPVTGFPAQETGNGNVQPGFALGGFIGTPAVGSVGGQPRIFGGSAINSPLTYDSSGNPTAQSPSMIEKEPQAMVAFSGDDGSQAWFAPMAYTYGATTTANGVVYVGSLDGMVRAFDASSGQLLWAFPTGAPMSSGASIVSGGIVLGTGTDESDVEFKTCAQLPNPSLSTACKGTPLNATVNPLSRLGAVEAFSE